MELIAILAIMIVTLAIAGRKNHVVITNEKTGRGIDENV